MKCHYIHENDNEFTIREKLENILVSKCLRNAFRNYQLNKTQKTTKGKYWPSLKVNGMILFLSVTIINSY